MTLRKIVLVMAGCAVLAGCTTAAHAAVTGARVTRAPASRAHATRAAASGRCDRPARLGAGVSVAAWRLGAIMFTSERSGVALTASSIPCVIPLPDHGGEDLTYLAQPVRLAVTGDGGLHWRTVGSALPADDNPAAQRVSAVNGPDLWVVNGPGALYDTRDNGGSWSRQPVPVPVMAAESAGGWLWSLSCSGTGRAAGQPVVERMRLSGGRWVKTNLKMPAVSDCETLQFAVASGNVAVVAATGPHTTLASTIDGGAHWSFQPPPPHWRQLCYPEWAGMFALAGPEDWWLMCNGALYRTWDAGRTWTVYREQVSESPGATIISLAAAAPDTLWSTSPNYLAVSTDGGRSWSGQDQFNLGGGGGQFDVLTPTDCWLLAPGGGLWRTTNATTWQQLGSLGPM